jgi:hypothetical protein
MKKGYIRFGALLAVTDKQELVDPEGEVISGETIISCTESCF